MPYRVCLILKGKSILFWLMVVRNWISQATRKVPWRRLPCCKMPQSTFLTAGVFLSDCQRFPFWPDVFLVCMSARVSFFSDYQCFTFIIFLSFLLYFIQTSEEFLVCGIFLYGCFFFIQTAAEVFLSLRLEVLSWSWNILSGCWSFLLRPLPPSHMLGGHLFLWSIPIKGKYKNWLESMQVF